MLQRTARQIGCTFSELNVANRMDGTEIAENGVPNHEHTELSEVLQKM